MDFKHYSLCFACADIRGGKMPKGHCATVTAGKCPYCKVVCTLVPHVDFTWPGQRKLTTWD